MKSKYSVTLASRRQENKLWINQLLYFIHFDKHALIEIFPRPIFEKSFSISPPVILRYSSQVSHLWSYNWSGGTEIITVTRDHVLPLFSERRGYNNGRILWKATTLFVDSPTSTISPERDNYLYNRKKWSKISFLSVVVTKIRRHIHMIEHSYGLG